MKNFKTLTKMNENWFFFFFFYQNIIKYSISPQIIIK